MISAHSKEKAQQLINKGLLPVHYWSHDESKDMFVCEDRNRILEMPVPVDGDGWACDKCWRQCKFARFGDVVTHVFEVEKNKGRGHGQK